MNNFQISRYYLLVLQSSVHGVRWIQILTFLAAFFIFCRIQFFNCLRPHVIENVYCLSSRQRRKIKRLFSHWDVNKIRPDENPDEWIKCNTITYIAAQSRRGSICFSPSKQILPLWICSTVGLKTGWSRRRTYTPTGSVESLWIHANYKLFMNTRRSFPQVRRMIRFFNENGRVL